VIFIIKTKAMDEFNLQGYLKNNRLLKESIGGYVDMKPMKERTGPAMDDTVDYEDESLPTFEDVKQFLDAQKFTPTEVRDAGYLEDKLYDYYEDFRPELVGINTSKHDRKLVKMYQKYYMNKLSTTSPKRGKVKEELGTAMGEEDFGYAKHDGDFSDDDSEFGGGYIQSFGPKFEEALNLMDEAFREWRSGPMTRKEDIRPAIIELITHVKEHFLNYRP
jgi:hypothetical protein